MYSQQTTSALVISQCDTANKSEEGNTIYNFVQVLTENYNVQTKVTDRGLQNGKGKKHCTSFST